MQNQHSDNLVKAAEFFAKAQKKFIATEHGIHAETLIAASARMAGTMLFRSFGAQLKNTPPGTVVLSEQANSAGPKLMNVMLATLQQLGHKITEQSIMSVAPMTIQMAQLTLLETQKQLDPIYAAYCKAARLSFEDAAYASAIATGILIYDCHQVLDANRAASLAINGMVEGVKTAPLPFPDAATPDIHV